MKKVIQILVAVLFLAAASNCILTDKIVAPAGSKKGSAIKKDVQNAAMTGYMLGLTAAGGQVGSTNLSGSIVSGLTAQASASIKDDQYYTGSSADDCVSAVQNRATMIAYSIFNSTSTMVSLVSGCAPTYDMGCLNTALGSTVGLTAGGACDLKETGKVINLGDKIKI